MTNDKTFEVAVTIPLTITQESLSDMVFGTGALTWEWWLFADEKADGIMFTHSPEYPENGTFKTFVTWEKLAEAYAYAFSHGLLSEYVRVDEELSEPAAMDAADADVVLQVAVGLLHDSEDESARNCPVGHEHVVFG